MSTVTQGISEAEAQRRADAVSRMNKPVKQAKGVMTRLTNLLGGMDKDSPEFAQLQAEIAELVGVGQSSPDEVTVASDEGALEILRRDQNKARDYDGMIESMEKEKAEQFRLYQQATSNEVRNAHSMRIDTLADLQRIVEAAKHIEPGKRTFGCRDVGGLRVSGRDSVFPDVKFSRHTVTTEDPLVIARLLDYIENPGPGDPRIEVRNVGDVALINDQSGKFGQWVPANEAEDVIRSMGGTLRRPFR